MTRCQERGYNGYTEECQGRPSKLRGGGQRGVRSVYLEVAERNREGVQHRGPGTASVKTLQWENVAWCH